MYGSDRSTALGSGIGTFYLTTIGGSTSTTFILPVNTSYNVSETVPTGWELTSQDPF